MWIKIYVEQKWVIDDILLGTERSSSYMIIEQQDSTLSRTNGNESITTTDTETYTETETSIAVQWSGC